MCSIGQDRVNGWRLARTVGIELVHRRGCVYLNEQLVTGTEDVSNREDFDVVLVRLAGEHVLWVRE